MKTVTVTRTTLILSFLLAVGASGAYATPVETIVIKGKAIGTWDTVTGWDVFFGGCILAEDCHYKGVSSLGIDPASRYPFDDEMFEDNVPPFSGAGRSLKFIPIFRVGSAFNWRDAGEPHQRTFSYCVSGVDPNCPIKVAETVPEPAALLLLGMGLLAFSAFRRP